MATGTERSKTLHNFTMPGELRWRNQRFLRCMKVNSDADGRISPLRRFAADKSFSSDQRRRGNNPVQQPRTSRDGGIGRGKDSDSDSLHGSLGAGAGQPPASDGGRRFSSDDNGIAAIREKESEVSASQPSPPPPPYPAAASVDGVTNKPWNLRTRRAGCRTPAIRFATSGNGGATVAAAGEKDTTAANGAAMDAPNFNSGFLQTRVGLAATVVDKSPKRHRGGDAAAVAANGEKRERPKFTVALSKRDVEEDFLSMVGHRPPRRPKKRAKIVQRQLDTLFPGLWLTEVTPDMYKVSESAP
ncbi:hypothetical protein MIMGU_mgv1a010835mg [Erythranthe guttata]|uniref:DUF1639 domain-containing protein n=1 Tax=Erythranthe guttata TaxID=4155 RepID=A0A022RPB3_ERYGU|nr:hypothetical protein MIMGU_mgv1a010835mg [Erythranthe guttata]